MFTRSFRTVTAITFVISILGFAAQSAAAQAQHKHSMSTDKSADQKHHREVSEHGDMAMGFSHEKTTHHFGLTQSGGFIEVQANDAEDTASRDHIRAHLQHISKSFEDGDFAAPEMTHRRVPPGVPTMQQRKSVIEYKYEETNTGGKVLISTSDAEALKAVHEFLHFQIEDHQTGDSTAVRK